MGNYSSSNKINKNIIIPEANSKFINTSLTEIIDKEISITKKIKNLFYESLIHNMIFFKEVV